MDAMQAETVWVSPTGEIVANGTANAIEAYLARPLQRQRVGSVVVIHHMPGYDEPTREITRGFAARGFAAICPNLYTREASGKSPEETFAIAMAQSGAPDDQLVHDVNRCALLLRGLSGGNDKVGVIGFCSGGRQALMAACEIPFDAAIDCYGSFVVTAPAAETKLQIKPIIGRAADLSCPLLGIFGADDQFPSPTEVAETERLLVAAGKTVEFHSFDGAGHEIGRAHV